MTGAGACQVKGRLALPMGQVPWGQGCSLVNLMPSLSRDVQPLARPGHGAPALRLFEFPTRANLSPGPLQRPTVWESGLRSAPV